MKTELKTAEESEHNALAIIQLCGEIKVLCDFNEWKKIENRLTDFLNNALAVGREKGLRDSQFLNWIKNHCKIVYYGTDYPVEHNLAAKKDGWDFLTIEFLESVAAIEQGGE